MQKNTILLLCALICVGSSRSFAADAWPPGKNIGDAIGVQIKNSASKEDLEAIKETGFKYVRLDLNWPSIETAAGVYDWSGADRIISDLRLSGLNAVIILGGSNKLYGKMVPARPDNVDHLKEVSTAPATPVAMQAFARFAAQAVSRYDGSDVVWEIWNEPDLYRFWAPKPDVNAFSVLTELACKSMRKASPQAVVVGPALAQVPDEKDGVSPEFLKKFLKSSALQCLDAFSMHPYRHGDEVPEAAQVDYEIVRSTMLYSDKKNKRVLPIVNSEWGYSTTQASEERQADYILRSYLVNLLNGVPLSIWYEWKDTPRSDPEDPEGHFGIVSLDGQTKPAAEVLREKLAEIGGYKIVRRLQTPESFDYILILQNEKKKQVIAAWTIRPGEEGTANMLVMDGGDSTVYPLSGRPVIVPVSDVDTQILIMGNGGEH